MTVRTAYDFPTNTLLVAFGDDKHNGVIEGGRIVYHPVEPGSTIEPLLRLSVQEAGALRDALAEDGLVSGAAHLRDAIGVRDRLLTLVERLSEGGSCVS